MVRISKRRKRGSDCTHNSRCRDIYVLCISFSQNAINAVILQNFFRSVAYSVKDLLSAL